MMRIIRKRIVPLSAILLCIVAPSKLSAAKPKLVVNIVISQMRYDYLSKFGKNFSRDGFRKFMDDGLVFTDSRYNFMQTTTPAALATLTTGSDPSMHGIVSDRWVDYTTNRTVRLIEDLSVYGIDCDAGIGRYSPANMTVPTLGDKLKEESPESKVIAIAVCPLSAIVLGGQTSDVYWMDETRGNWITSTAYCSSLPNWVNSYNALRVPKQYLDYEWRPYLLRDSYVNSVYSVMETGKENRFKKLMSLDFLKRGKISRDYPSIPYTPAGNIVVAEFAKQAIKNEELGRHDRTDMLYVCFDSPRLAGELYGSESLEVEDMFYRLDSEIAGLLSFISSQVDMEDVLVVLTSDHGASDSYDYGKKPRERFNAAQFKVIVNGFMNAQYGVGDWVLDYCDRQLYLNRNQIYKNGLSLEEVQNRVAAFVLQFRGVSHVLTSTAMQTSFFSGSYAEKMQNGFYPKRSGDLTINLMPGWIEEEDGKRACSGSMYEYDTHVPLMMLGRKIGGGKVMRTVDMRDVAPTLARIMQISRPIASHGEPIEEVVRLY